MQFQPDSESSLSNRTSASAVIMNSIRRVVQALRVSSRAIERDLGLSAAQLFVLQKLGEGGVLSIKEIAERTLTHQSSVSAVVSRLIEGGWVHRSRSSEDRRRNDVVLSDAGSQLLKGSPVSAQERLLDAIARMPHAEQEQLSVLIEKMIRLAGLSSEPAPMLFEEDLLREEGQSRHRKEVKKPSLLKGRS